MSIGGTDSLSNNLFNEEFRDNIPLSTPRTPPPTPIPFAEPIPLAAPREPVDLPGLQFPAIDIPSIDVSAPEINFQATIDSLQGVAFGVDDPEGLTGGDVNAGIQPAVDIDFSRIEEGLTGGTTAGVDVPEPRPVDSESKANLAKDLGLNDFSVGRHDPTRFGSILIDDSGESIEAPDLVDEVTKSLFKGTALENANPSTLVDISNSPDEVLKNASVGDGAELLEGLGMEAELAVNTAAIFAKPKEWVEEKGTKESIDLLNKEFDMKIPETAAAEEVVATLETQTAKEKRDAKVKKTTTDVTLKAVETGLNVAAPGIGTLVVFLAKASGYSCYLSTSAYKFGFIDKKEYFEFTRYRLDIQRHEFLSTPIWLGYISFFEPRYERLIEDEIYVSSYYRLFRPVLDHAKYKLGSGPFSFKGLLGMGILKTICLGSYLLNYKKSKKKKKKLKGLDIVALYRSIVRAVEGDRAYG